MKRKKIAVCDLSRFNAFSTKRLLMRLNRLQECEQSFGLSDKDLGENTPAGFIEFKESPDWIAEYEYLKELLSKREHIDQPNLKH